MVDDLKNNLEQLCLIVDCTKNNAKSLCPHHCIDGKMPLFCTICLNLYKVFTLLMVFLYDDIMPDIYAPLRFGSKQS